MAICTIFTIHHVIISISNHNRQTARDKVTTENKHQCINKYTINTVSKKRQNANFSFSNNSIKNKQI